MKVYKTLILSAVVFSIFSFTACFSPWADGEGTLTFNFGENAGARNIISGDEYNDFSHKVILRNSENQTVLEQDFHGSRGTVSVPAGTYKVTIKGYGKGNGENDLGAVMRSYGTNEGTVQIKSGQSLPVKVAMFSAAEVESWSDLQGVVMGAGQFPKIELLVFIKKDLRPDYTIFNRNSNITLIAEHHVIIDASYSNGALFNLYSDSNQNTLTLGAEGMTGTITIFGNKAAELPLIDVQNGTLVLNDRVYIKNHITTNSLGGAVSVNGGNFNMNGGEISGNSAGLGGGVGLYLGTFNMSGGIISGNSANNISNSSGGDSGYGDSDTGYGDGNSGSSGDSGDGGGVYVRNAVFIMTGGTISDNTAKNTVNTTTAYSVSGNGGGVFINGSDSKFFQIGGTISNNTAYNGGGVYVSDYGDFNMRGGIIAKNKATYGGGVYIDINSSSFKKDDGIIYGSDETNNKNTAEYDNGHAIYAFYGPTTFYVKNKTAYTELSVFPGGSPMGGWND